MTAPSRSLFGAVSGLWSARAATGMGVFALAISQLLLARFLAPEVYGRFSFLTAWASFAAMIAASGMQMAVMAHLPRQPREIQDGLARAALAVTARNAALAAALGTAVATLLFPTRIGITTWQVVILAGLAILIATCAVRSAASMARGKHWASQLPDNVMRPGLFLAAAWLISERGDLFLRPLFALIAALAISYCLALIIGLALDPYRKPKPDAQGELAKYKSELTRSARNNAIANLTSSSARFGDVLIAGLLLKPEQLALYVILTRLFDLSCLVYQILDLPSASTWSRQMINADLGGLRLEISVYNRTAVVWAFASALVMLGGGEQLMALFGPHYSQGAALLWVVALTGLVKSLLGPGGMLLVVLRAERELLVVSGASAVIYLVLVGILVDHLGVLGGLLSMLAYQFVRCLSYAIVAQRLTGVRVAAVGMPQRRVPMG